METTELLEGLIKIMQSLDRYILIDTGEEIARPAEITIVEKAGKKGILIILKHDPRCYYDK
ncbi:MAG: hypothetical protein DRP65_04200 [Planctomycetota bacterium]|nr:MAG: hypothetical protein DRP65_04200 [Planctomycetota bacterium]